MTSTTTPIDPGTTLATLVIERPELAARLDMLGLDYCCGGQRTLAAAIAEAGIDAEATVEQLTAIPLRDAPTEWEGVGGLVDHLESTHHAYLHEAMPRLVALADKVAGVHGERHPELGEVASLVHAIRDDLDPHLAKEERVLFPMIRQLAVATEPPTFHCGSIENPIIVMLAEHDHVGELLAQLRSTTDAFLVPADGCASYTALYQGLAELEADTHVHVHKENNVLFPMVNELEARLAARR